MLHASTDVEFECPCRGPDCTRYSTDGEALGAKLHSSISRLGLKTFKWIAHDPPTGRRLFQEQLETGEESEMSEFGVRCPTGNHIVSLSGTRGDQCTEVSIAHNYSASFTDGSSVPDP